MSWLSDVGDALGGYASSNAEKAKKKDSKDAGPISKPNPEDSGTWKMETYVDDKGDLKERKVKSKE